jgi:hypothetical protein
MQHEPQQEQPKQVPAEVQRIVDQVKSAGGQVTVVNASDAESMKGMPLEFKHAMLTEAAHYYHGAAHHFAKAYKASNRRFYVSLAANVVLLAILWWPK